MKKEKPTDLLNQFLKFSNKRAVIIMLILPLIGSLIIISSYYSFIQQTKNDIFFTDIAGRQRMLSEQMGHFTHTIFNLKKDDDRELLRKSVVLFDHSLTVLDQGGEIMGRKLSPPQPEIKIKVEQVIRLWTNIKPALLLIAEQPQHSQETEKAYIFLKTRVPQLRDLSDEIVSRFEMLNSNRKEMLLKTLISILVFNFILLSMGVVITKKYLAEQKLAEEKIRESERLYRTLTEAARDAIFIVDDDDNIVFINTLGAGLFQKAPNDIIGLPLNKIFPHSVYTKQAKALKYVFKTGKSINVEFDLLFEKQKTWFSTWLVPLKNDTGEIHSIMGIAHDITSNKRNQLILEENERRLREAQKIAQIGNWEFNVTTSRIIGSREFYRIFNLKPQEFPGTFDAFLDCIHPDDREMVSKAYTESVKKRTRLDIIHRLLLNGKTIKYVNERCDTIYDDSGTPIRSIGTVQDITERVKSRKKIEEALEKARQGERVKTLFLANMSHEIRTPLNGILGFLELIEGYTRPLLEEDKHEFFDQVRTNGDRLMRTVSEILEISQLEAGTYKTNIGDINLVNLGEMVIKKFRTPAEQKGLELDYVTDLENAPIRADEQGIYQALSNLIDNAVKYTENGKVILSLKQQTNAFVFTIRDTGIGISPEYLKRMYAVFSQESEGYTKKYQGIGLGMAIAKRHLDMNGAKLKVESKKSVGTTFTLTFQSAEKKRDDQKDIHGHSSVKVALKPGEKHRILVVEDELSSQKLIVAFLKEDYDVSIAVSVQEAKQQLKEHRVHLVLLDLSLEGRENGLDLVNWMRKTKTWKRIPVIATTAHALPTDRENCMKAGCNDYSSKPLKRKNLLKKIRSYL
ncbi:MAG: PAS domain-containing protein [Chlorobi bacterium]|nr:PAS domain-containing protein [Chlorobiota bacterium]